MHHSCANGTRSASQLNRHFDHVSRCLLLPIAIAKMIGFFNLAWTGNTSVLPSAPMIDFPQPESRTPYPGELARNCSGSATAEDSISETRGDPVSSHLVWLEACRTLRDTRRQPQWHVPPELRQRHCYGPLYWRGGCSPFLDPWLVGSCIHGPSGPFDGTDCSATCTSALGSPLGRSVWAPWPGWISGLVGVCWVPVSFLSSSQLKLLQHQPLRSIRCRRQWIDHGQLEIVRSHKYPDQLRHHHQRLHHPVDGVRRQLQRWCVAWHMQTLDTLIAWLCHALPMLSRLRSPKLLAS